MLLSNETLLVNRYLIIRHIGYSGAAILYEAKDQHLNRFVTLKQQALTDVSLPKRFERKVQILTRLRRSTVRDCFIDENWEFSVIECLSDDSHTLLECQKTPLAIDQVLEWASQLLYTLEYLHSRPSPIIHGNIRPCNIKLLSQNEVILLNVGMHEESDMSHMALTGSPDHYASPEQVNGLKIDVNSDLYSVGATLYYLLSGIKPPTAMARMYALMNQLTDPLRAINELEPEIPLQVAHLLTTAMKLSPIERPSSARAMRRALCWVPPQVGSQKKAMLPQHTIWPLQPKNQLNRRVLKVADGLMVMVLLLVILVEVDLSSMFTIHGDTSPPPITIHGDTSPPPIRLVIPTVEPETENVFASQKVVLQTEEASAEVSTEQIQEASAEATVVQTQEASAEATVVQTQEASAKAAVVQAQEPSAKVSVVQAEEPSAEVTVVQAVDSSTERVKAIQSESANTLSNPSTYRSLPIVIDQSDSNSPIVSVSSKINSSEAEVNLLSVPSETFTQQPEISEKHDIQSRESDDISSTSDYSNLITASIITLKQPIDRAIYLCNDGGDLISFQWQWNESLQSKQYFELRMWQDGTTHHSVAKTNENGYIIDPMDIGAGQYFWSVAVMDKETGKEVSSETWPRVLIIR